MRHPSLEPSRDRATSARERRHSPATFAWSLCVLAAMACGKEGHQPRSAPSKATLDDCRAQLRVYAECHAQAHAREPKAPAPAELEAKIEALGDLGSCEALLGDLQRDGYGSCWPR